MLWQQCSVLFANISIKIVDFVTIMRIYFRFQKCEAMRKTSSTWITFFTMSRICHIKYPIFAFKKHYSWKVCITRAPWFSTSINSMQYCNTRLTDEYSHREYTSPLTSLSRHHIIYEGYLENNDTLIIFL